MRKPKESRTPERDVERRLAEAEATIEALLSGQIDAVVDSKTMTPVLLAKAQDALRESEERYRGIVETANEGIGTMDSESNFTFVNPRLAEMFGYRADEMLGKPLNRFMERGSGGRAAPRSEDDEACFERKDGAELWVLLKTSPIRDADGKCIGTLAMMTDRTRQRQAVEAVRESEARYRRIVETTNQGVWLLDALGATTFMNEPMASMLGYSRDETVGLPVIDCVDEKCRGEILVAKERNRQVEVKLRRKDGSGIWVLLEAAPMLGESGTYEGSFAMVMDVTARRKSEEALRVSESRFRRLWDSGLILITISDATGNIDDINEAGARMLGYTRAELLSGCVRWDDVTPPEWRAVDEAALAQIGAGGVARPWQKELLRKDGSRVPVLAGAALLEGSEGIAIAVDMTEKIRAETDRRLAEERQSAVVDAALDAVVGMDREGAIIEFNPAAEQTFGYSRAEALGRTLADLIIPPRLREAHTRGLERYLESGEGPVIGMRMERSAVRRDGVEIPVEISISRVGSGETPTFVGFIRDISERKRVESALAERMRVAALAADVGMALTAGETLRESLQECCEAVVRHLGAALARVWTLNGATKVLELEASDGLYTHLDGPDVRVPLGADEVGLIAYAREPHLTNDLQNDPRLGDREWARREGLRSFAGHPLLIGGDLVGVMAVFGREPMTDVPLKAIASVADAIAVRVRGKLAERANVALEAHLRQAQKMEAVGRLAGGIAHDFNNLLSVILSYGDLILGDLKPGDPLRADLEEIQKAGVRAAALTRQLLTFSRQQVMDPKVLDLNEVLSEMGNMLRRLVGEDVELMSLAGASVGRVLVDPGSIEQVIMNLAVNARDAMPIGGKLTMETADVALDESYATTHLGVKAGPYVMFSVTDTGTGMDHATLARIFDPFFTTKETGKGTGLGLSTVFGIVQQSGGNIFVDSQLGIGTTFKIYLPRVDAPAEGARATERPMSQRGSETILVVEDEDQVRDVARGILRRHGYRVLEARNAGEALLLCEGHKGPIHLLLSDVVMPGMSGPELAKRLAEGRPDMRVLCMSGYTDDSALRHGVVHAALAYLQKPLTVQSLTRKVREVLDGARSAA